MCFSHFGIIRTKLRKLLGKDFEIERERVNFALQEYDTIQILIILFNRLYTLRNQIMNGGATYNSSVNRKQLKDACIILIALIPAFIHICSKIHNV